MSERLEDEIRAAINRASAENASDTPDFILAAFLIGCLAAFNAATTARTKWYGLESRWPKGVAHVSPPSRGDAGGKDG